MGWSYDAQVPPCNFPSPHAPIMPIVLIGVILSLLYYSYKDYFQNLSGMELWMLSFAFFLAGILAGVLTQRFSVWKGKPFFKKDGEDYNSRLRRKLIKWGLIYAIELPPVFLIAWLLAAKVLPPSEFIFWQKRYLFLFSYLAGTPWGTLIPPLLELYKTSRVDREN